MVIIFPSLFWLILESSTINSKKLPHYGPKVLKENTKDSLYYEVPDYFYSEHCDSSALPEQLSKKQFPLYAIVFVSEKYRGDAYRLTGLWEYLNYKADKIDHIPFILVSPEKNGQSFPQDELRKLSESKNVHFRTWPSTSYDSLVKIYFKEKPYYIDYSFFMLVDAQRNIRGYYDARYVSEIKRLIDEYQHLRLKEEKQLLIYENEIKTEH